MVTAPDRLSSAPRTVAARGHGGAVGAISGLIIAILGLQTVAGFVNTGRWGWPFIAYPMYKTAHFEGERLLHEYKVFATHANSSEDLISAGDVPFWIFKFKMVDGLTNGDRASVQPLVAAYCERTGKEVIAVRVEDTGLELTRNGIVRGLPPKTLAKMQIGCED